MLIDWAGWVPLVAVLAVFAVVQALEGWVITPRIVGEKVGMSPVTVILVLLVGGLTVLWLRAPKKQFIERLTDYKLAGLVVLAGIGDVLGNVTFLIATRSGALAIAAVLTSLYPVGTILLARVFLKERIATSQAVGIVLALAACAVLAAG